MYLNELLDENNKTVALLKFSEKKHLESLKSGNLYLNNFQYFKDLENEAGRKGQGDAKDLTVVLNDVNFELRDIHTSKVLLKGKAERSTLESAEDYKRHVFCCTGVTSDILEVVEVKEDIATVRLNLPDELKEKALTEFGGHVAFINSGLFLEKIKKSCQEQGITLFTNMISYKDMNINYSDRIHAFNNNELSLYFEKDVFFKYQNEFRIVFPDLISDKAETINVGSLDDAITILSVEEFLNCEVLFNLRLYKKEY